MHQVPKWNKSFDTNLCNKWIISISLSFLICFCIWMNETTAAWIYVFLSPWLFVFQAAHSTSGKRDPQTASSISYSRHRTFELKMVQVQQLDQYLDESAQSQKVWICERNLLYPGPPPIMMPPLEQEPTNRLLQLIFSALLNCRWSNSIHNCISPSIESVLSLILSWSWS